MERLTALERELLRSVSALETGFRQDMSALRDGLETSATNSSDVWEERLNALETAQSYLDQRLATIEEHQLAMLERLNEVSRICATQLKGYETQIENLVKALNGFKK